MAHGRRCSIRQTGSCDFRCSLDTKSYNTHWKFELPAKKKDGLLKSGAYLPAVTACIIREYPRQFNSAFDKKFA